MEAQFLDTEAAFALRVKHFHDRLSDQMAEALLADGLLLAEKTTGIVQLLYSDGPCSIAQIAHRLKYSHQLATQRLSWLISQGMAETDVDESDRRRQMVRLTDSGELEAKKLQQFLPKLRRAYRSLFDEIGVDLDSLVLAADQRLQSRGIFQRFSEELTSCERAN